MATCKKCGAEIEEGVKFCPNCGGPVAEEVKAETEAPKTEETKENGSEQNAFLKFLFGTKDTTADYDAKDIEDNKVMSILAYASVVFWPLWLVPFFVNKASKYTRFHCAQALLVLIGFAATTILAVAFSFIPVVKFIFPPVFYIADCALAGLAAVGIINVVKGKARELPIIGKYAFLK